MYDLKLYSKYEIQLSFLVKSVRFNIDIRMEFALKELGPIYSQRRQGLFPGKDRIPEKRLSLIFVYVLQSSWSNAFSRATPRRYLLFVSQVLILLVSFAEPLGEGNVNIPASVLKLGRQPDTYRHICIHT